MPTRPWAASSTPSTVSGSSSFSGTPRWRFSNQTPITATPNSAAIDRVPVDDEAERVGALEVQPLECWPTAPPEWGPAAVAAVPANSVSAASGPSARTDQTAHGRVERGRAPGLVGGSPGQRDRRDQDHHRQHEVRHHEPRRQLVLDRVAAEDRLRDDAERQQQRQHREVPPERLAPERQHGRDDTPIRRRSPTRRGCRTRSAHGTERRLDAVPKHFGQVGQPSPESVSRTAAPVHTIRLTRHSATVGELAELSGVISR